MTSKYPGVHPSVLAKFPTMTCGEVELERMVDEAKYVIERALLRAQRPIIAFSGGKDAIPVADILVKDFDMRDAVTELSFYFTEQKQAVRDSAKELGLNLKTATSYDNRFLWKNPQYVMTRSSALRSKFFTIRHQRTVRLTADRGGHGIVFLGRRSQENTVPKDLYQSKKHGQVWQCNPLRSWRHEHVWQYFKSRDITIPWAYRTPFGSTGQAPWTSCKWKKDRDEGWSIVYDCEPQIVVDVAEGLPEAERWLKKTGRL